MKAGETATFTAISYTLDDAGKTSPTRSGKSSLKGDGPETNYKLDGVTYDTHDTETVVVTVTDNGRRNTDREV